MSGKVPSAGGSVLSGEFTSSAVISTNLSSYTFSSMAFGAAFSGRHILVMVASRASSTQTITSATIGGVTATIVYQASPTGTLGAFLIAAVPTGTTGDVVINFSVAMTRCGIGVIALSDLVSTTATDTAIDSGSDTMTSTIDCDADGMIFGMCTSLSFPESITWTAGVTAEVLVMTIIETAQEYGIAAQQFSSSQTGLTVTVVTVSGSAQVAVWLALR